MNNEDNIRVLRETSVPVYQLTFIDNRNLLQRLIPEIISFRDQLEQLWRDIKADPNACALRFAKNCYGALRRYWDDRDRVAGSAASVIVITIAIMLAIAGPTPRIHEGSNAPVEIVELKTTHEIDSASLMKVREGNGNRTDFRQGKGEGSKPDLKPSRGGGGSGKHERPQVQQGKLLQVSAVPAPIVKAPIKNPALPQAGMDIDAKLWREQPFARYGDPRANVSIPSQGSGEGGNFGNGIGLGIGNGNGSGYGPGVNGNIGGGQKGIGGGSDGGDPGGDNPERVLPAREATERARVLMKPEPQYTEEARRNQIVGTVVLRVVFSRTGEVTNIRAVQTLPFGLTEQAILAARHIRFFPAMKNGRPVSVYMQLEYNFNLY